MNGLFYFLSMIILVHSGLMIFALLRMDQGSKNLYSICVGAAMILTALIAIALGSWNLLALGFALNCLLLMVETLIITWNRPGTPLIVPINLLMVTGAIVAFVSQIWLIFLLSYCLYWAASFLVSKYQLS